MSQCRILFVGPPPSSHGGIATVLANYRRSDFWRDFGCELYSMSGESDGFLGRWLGQVGRLLLFLPKVALGRPSAVSVHTASRRSFYRSLAYVLFSRLASVPVVLHIHPAYFIEFYRRGSALRQFLIRLAARASSQIVFLTEAVMTEFQDTVGQGRLVVIPNPVDTEEFRPGPGLAPQFPTALFLGWIVPEKGVYDIVDAIPAILERHPEVRFVFAGNKEVEKLRTLIRDRGLDGVAEVPGWVSGRAKRDLLQGSTVLLLPSYTEGIPNVLLEAMASGVPVVTTPVGGIPTVAEDGRTALFVSPGQIGQLADAVIRLLDDPGLRRRLAVAARAEVEARFSIPRIGALLAQTYARYCPERP